MWRDTKELTQLFLHVTMQWRTNSRVMFWNWWHCGPSGTRNSWDCCLMPCASTRCQCGVAVEHCSCWSEWEEWQQCHIYYRCMQSLDGVSKPHTSISLCLAILVILVSVSVCMHLGHLCFYYIYIHIIYIYMKVLLSHLSKWKWVFFTWCLGFRLWFLHI